MLDSSFYLYTMEFPPASSAPEESGQNSALRTVRRKGRISSVHFPLRKSPDEFRPAFGLMKRPSFRRAFRQDNIVNYEIDRYERQKNESAICSFRSIVKRPTGHSFPNE